MTRKLLTIVVLGLAFMAFAPFAHAISIVNGSFEADAWAGHLYDLETAGLTGWTALDPGNNSPLYPWGINESEYGVTPWGEQFVVIGGYGADLGTSIQQTISGLVVGDLYTLNFGLASEGYTAQGRSGSANVQLSMLAGSATASASYAPGMSVSWYWDTWTMYSYDFVANATSATFAFEDLAMTGEGYDIGIDNVSIEGAGQVIPEPATMALFGLGMLGMATLRKRFKK